MSISTGCSRLALTGAPSPPLRDVATWLPHIPAPELTFCGIEMIDLQTIDWMCGPTERYYSRTPLHILLFGNTAAIFPSFRVRVAVYFSRAGYMIGVGTWQLHPTDPRASFIGHTHDGDHTDSEFFDIDIPSGERIERIEALHHYNDTLDNSTLEGFEVMMPRPVARACLPTPFDLVFLPAAC